MKLYVDENPSISHIKRRIRNHKNCLIVVIGKTGSGKSYGVLKLGEILDKNFNIDRVSFHAKEFIENAKDTNLKSGSVIVLDEAGISMDNRTWWQTHNRMINWLLQTFRYRRLIVFITVPKLSFIDKKSISLFHYILETTGIDGHNKTCSMKFKKINPNLMSLKDDKDFYQKYPIVRDSQGNKIKLKKILLHLPSLELRKKYEEKKKGVMNRLYEEALISLGGDGKLGSENMVTPPSKREKELLVLMKKYPDLGNKELAEMIGITANNVSTLKSNLKDKNMLSK